MRKLREVNLFEDAGHLAEQIHRNAVEFAQLDTECMECEHRLFGESTTPFGVRGFVQVSVN